MVQEFDLRSILPKLSHDELLEKTQKLAEAERRISLTILHHLAEIDRRRAYAKLGYASLWDYALKELKYSESAAYRRISAMRALRNHPELEEKIQTGVLTVSVVSQVQSFLKAERDQANQAYSAEQKAAIFKQCENKSSREVTRELLKFSPLACRVQKERVITENRTVISFVADPPLLGKIHRVRDLSVPRLKNPSSYPELMDLMTDIALEEIDPLRRPMQKQVKPRQAVREPMGMRSDAKFDQNIAPITSETHPQSGEPLRQARAISPSLRTQIWQEFGGRCAYVDAESGKRCDSTFGLEIEHCKPFSMGGSSKDPKNLRLLCRHHNQWQAIQSYGLKKMERYWKDRATE